MQYADRIWGGYPRISDDPNDTQNGVGRQTDDIAASVRSLGADPAAIAWYPENDTSAYKKRRVPKVDPLGNSYIGYRVIRPVWHRALHDLRTGKIDALMVWDLDRLARDPRDLEDAIEVVQYYGALIVSSTPGQIDLTNDSGIAMARVLVAMNNKSSADTARRVAREHLAAAQQGIPRGGVRPFGYEKDKSTIRESEAKEIRWAAEQVLSGTSLSALARELQERGVKTTRGHDFVPKTLRTVLINARYAGWRTDKHRQIVHHNGEPVRGLWEPVLDQDTFDRVQLVLNDPSRKRGVRGRKGARKYLLSGLLRCGICGGLLYGHPDRRRGVSNYTCRALRGQRHALAGSVSGIERVVVAQVGLRLIGTTPAKTSSAFAGDARLAEIDQMITEAYAEMRANPRISKSIYAHIGALEDERAELEAQRSSWLAETSGPKLKAPLTPKEWEGLEAGMKRAHIDNLLEAVVLNPPLRKGPKFDPGRLTYVWR